MRRSEMTRRSIVAAAVLASVVLLAAPASAKGIESARFTGPGLPQGGIRIHGDHPQLFDLGALTDPSDKSTRPFSGATGPAYRAVVRFDFAPTDPVTVIVYPYAAGGPRTYTPVNQPLAGSFAPYGWYQSMPGLLTFLKKNGFPAHAPSVTAAAAGATSSASSGSWPVWAWMLLAVGIGASLLLVASRQRRRIVA
jgi:hypothetical protein